MMIEKVSVVIPVYGQWNLLKRNIDSLLKYDHDLIEEIIVVDDCSPEANLYPFNKQFVQVIKNPENLGYTGTVNKGLKTAKSDIILLLDSDAYAVNSFIARLLEKFHEDEKIGCIGVQTVDDFGKTTGSYQFEPSTIGFIVGQQLEARLNRFLRWKNKNILPYSCSVSFRRNCLEEMNFFDAVNFKVLEADNDLSMRIHRSKWKLRFANDIVVSHQGGNSYKVNNNRVLLYHESRWKLLRKHGLITSPAIARMLLTFRIKVEIIVFRLLHLIRRSKPVYLEKMEGRKIILEKTAYLN